MPDAAIRIHDAKQTFEGGLLENERSRETPNHRPHYHDCVHFRILPL